MSTRAAAAPRWVATIPSVLLFTALLGAVIGFEAPAAHATPTPEVQATPTALTSGETPVRGFRKGCLGPEALCDLAGEATKCVKNAAECASNAAEEVSQTASDIKDGLTSGVDEAVNGLKDLLDSGRGVAGNLPGLPGGLPGGGSCGILDALCGILPGLGGIPGPGGVPGIPGPPSPADLLSGGITGLDDIPNPMTGLGDIIAKAAADAWTAAMLAIWHSGLFILRIVLTFAELFLTPDLSADGPGKIVYQFTLWMALALVVILTMVQLGTAAFKREGKSLARAFIGAGQFVVICAIWFGYCVMIVAACGAITHALMKSLLGVKSWPEWDPMAGLGVESIVDATVATVLAFLGIFLWLAALGHLLIYLARAASLLLLVATGPLAASGLVAESTRSWFWKSLRWFHAAAFTPVLMVMVLGIGVQMANGVSTHLSDGAMKAIGTALPSVMLILVSVVAPLALFKLLAFVDPSTPSGASFRQGMAIQGGVQGLLSGGGGGGGSSAASSTGASGRSSGEESAESSTGDRFNQSTQGALGKLGAVGAALGAGLGMVNSAGAKGNSLMADETNQAGVGQNTYGPDFSGLRGSNDNGSHPKSGGDQSEASDQSGSQGGDDRDGDGPSMPTAPAPPAPPTPPAGGQAAGGGGAPTPAAGSGSGGAGAGAAGGAGGAGGAAAAGGIPPVV